MMYTLLWVPKSGLFYDGGQFLDGRQRIVPWGRTIHLYESHSRAVEAKKRIIARYPEAKGEVVVLGVHRVDEKGA